VKAASIGFMPLHGILSDSATESTFTIDFGVGVLFSPLPNVGGEPEQADAVTLPFTSYSVTYYKPANSRHLLARKFTNKDDPQAPMTSAEFLAKGASSQRQGA
jgi:hypothetical protein